MPLDARFEVGGRGGEALGDALEAGVLVEEVALGRGAGERLDAARAGGDGGLAEDMHESELPGLAHMGAAAEFGAEGSAIAADLDDAHLGAVLVAEEGQRAAVDGVLVGGHAPFDGEVPADDAVHERFNPRRGSRGERSQGG